MRKVKEWIGATDDSDIPVCCKLRIIDKAEGRCAECQAKCIAIGCFHIDHIIALCNGGENRESNLQLLCLHDHKAKSAADVAEKSKVNRVRKKHLGIVSPRQKIQSRGFAKAEPQRTASRPIERRS